MPIVVYGYAASSCTQRVLTTLAEKNLDFQLKTIDPTAHENEVNFHSSSFDFIRLSTGREIFRRESTVRWRRSSSDR